MPTDVKLLRWAAEGLRCPDHTISFERGGNVDQLALIQMPNGTGKTTTLSLLRAALSGDASVWNATKVRSFQKRDSEASRGTFRVDLLANGKRVTISLSLNFDEGVVNYATTITSSGMREGFHPPQELVKFMKPGFVRFFVFDGELAEHLLDGTRTDAESVMEDLFELRLFTSLKREVGEYWTTLTDRRGATEDKGRTRRVNRVATLKKRLAYVQDAEACTKSKFDELSKELRKRQSKFDADLAAERKLGDRLRHAEKNFAEEASGVREVSKSILDKLKSPHAMSASFAREMVTFRLSLDRAKLPGSSAREFFEELSQEDVCICGMELDEPRRQTIRERASRYIGGETVALLNALKESIKSLVEPDSSADSSDVARHLEDLRLRVRREGEAKTVRDAIEAEGIKDDPALEQAKIEIGSLEKDVAECKAGLDKFESLDDALGDERTFGIKILKRRLEDAEKKLAEVTHTIELRSKRDVLCRILESAHTAAREGIGREICDEANKRIVELMPYNNIRIKELKSCVILEGQEGGSVGETLSVGYAFLSTLFYRTDHHLPFIVDSPANPIDLAVRGKVAELIPKLTAQFIAFTISSEREGFVEPLEHAATTPVRFITLFRKGNDELDRLAKAETGVAETADGFCVEGKTFFKDFHVVQDEGGDVV